MQQISGVGSAHLDMHRTCPMILSLFCWAGPSGRAQTRKGQRPLCRPDCSPLFSVKGELPYGHPYVIRRA